MLDVETGNLLSCKQELGAFVTGYVTYIIVQKFPSYYWSLSVNKDLTFICITSAASIAD